MDSKKSAIDVLITAEAQLKDIAHDALTRGDYLEVETITTLAKSLAKLRLTIPGSSKQRVPSSPRAIAIVQPGEVARSASAPAGTDYPRFERHGKRLVKLGWSSKDNRIYEQRAPLEVVEEICQGFVEKVGAGKILRPEKLLPLKSEDGDEIPSYQVYLVLKWLQQRGVVERQGKDGYSFQTDFNIKTLWAETPSK